MEGKAITGDNMEIEFPSYSVLMAVYIKDIPEWFAYAIDSMIKQTIPPAEIVIVKDGPVTQELQAVLTDKSKEHPHLFKCKELEKNQGLGEALRVGVTECSNEWIVRMDADDYSSPERCEIQFKAVLSEEVDMVGCDINEFVGTPEHVIAARVFPETHDEIYKFAKRRTPFAHPGVIMKKSQIIQVGNYQSAHLHEDFDLFVRMLLNGCKGYTVKQPLVSMRVSNDFYARRGGISYLKALLRFNIKLYKSGWMGINDFIMRSGANALSCLLPNKLRDWMYKNLLRKSKSNS